MLQLVGGQQVLAELVAEVHVDLVETALALSELLEMHVNILPLGVLLLGLLLEVGEEVTLHLLLVEEVIAFVDYALETTAAKRLGLLTHAVVVVTLALVLRLGIDVDAEGLMAHDLHRRFITIAWIVVQVVRKLFSAFYFPCAEGHGLTNVTHIPYYLLVNIHL